MHVGTVREKWLAPDVARRALASTAVLVMRDEATTKPTIKSVWPDGTAAPARLLELAMRAMQTGRLVARRATSGESARATTIVAVPLGGLKGAPATGAFAAVLPGHLHEADALARVTGSMAAAVAATDPSDVHRPPSPAAPVEGSELAVRLVAVVSSAERFDGAAREFAAELASAIGCDRVAVGFIENGTARVTALSGAADLAAKGALVTDLAAAMDEALDQAATIAHPNPAPDAPAALAHERFAARHDSPTLCTVPFLVTQGEKRELVGAITLEFGRSKLDPATVERIEHVAAIVGPVLEFRRQQDGAFGTRMVGALSRRRRVLHGRHGTVAKVAAGAAAIALLAAAFVPVTHRVTASARLEGEMQRVLAAPVDGYIGEVHVRPGEAVRAGQALMTLDDRELRLEQRKWAAEAAQLEKQYGEALAREDQSRIAIQQARLAQARAQLAVVDEQLRRLSLLAPFDGVVIDGDLTQSLGAPVKRGETLMKVAPRERYRVIAEVDERDIGDLANGQRGQLLLAALSGSAEVEVVRTTPIATARNGRNYFEVEARLQTIPPGARPGLEGVAKIAVGERSVLWIVGNRLWSWLRLTAWKWRI